MKKRALIRKVRLTTRVYGICSHQGMGMYPYCLPDTTMYLVRGNVVVPGVWIGNGEALDAQCPHFLQVRWSQVVNTGT